MAASSRVAGRDSGVHPRKQEKVSIVTTPRVYRVRGSRKPNAKVIEAKERIAPRIHSLGTLELNGADVFEVETSGHGKNRRTDLFCRVTKETLNTHGILFGGLSIYYMVLGALLHRKVCKRPGYVSIGLSIEMKKPVPAGARLAIVVTDAKYRNGLAELYVEAIVDDDVKARAFVEVAPTEDPRGILVENFRSMKSAVSNIHCAVEMPAFRCFSTTVGPDQFCERIIQVGNGDGLAGLLSRLAYLLIVADASCGDASYVPLCNTDWYADRVVTGRFFADVDRIPQAGQLLNCRTDRPRNVGKYARVGVDVRATNETEDEFLSGDGDMVAVAKVVGKRPRYKRAEWKRGKSPTLAT